MGDDQSRTAATKKLRSSKSFKIKSLKLEITTDNEEEDKEDDNEETCTDTNTMVEQKLQNHNSKGEDRKESKKKKRIAKRFNNTNEEIVDKWIHNCYRPANIPIVKVKIMMNIMIGFVCSIYTYTLHSSHTYTHIFSLLFRHLRYYPSNPTQMGIITMAECTNKYHWP